MQILIVLILYLAASIASAQIALPNQTDLTASYCVGVIRSQIDSSNILWQKFIKNAPQSVRESFSNSIKKRESELRRLELYIIPRMPYLNVEGLLAAAQAGKEDFSNQGVTDCTIQKKCLYSSNTDQCIDQCQKDSPSWTRMQKCSEGLAFLP